MVKDKAESLADKMNKITAKFGDTLDNAESLEMTGDDVFEIINEKTECAKLSEEEEDNGCGTTQIRELPEVINLDNLIRDFKYVRETLKENTDNGRKILNAVTLGILTADEDAQASLIVSFAELNKALAANAKLYINSYKEISSVIINLSKVQTATKEIEDPDNENIIEGQIVSTSDLLKQLNEK